MQKTALPLRAALAAAVIAGGPVAAAHGSSAADGRLPQQAPGEPGGPGSIPERIQRTPDNPSVPAPGGMAPEAKPANPPQAIIGKEVVAADGKGAGEVKRIVGNQVIVTIGGFLGLGAHEVALLWKDLSLSGAGDEMRLRTPLTRRELEALPKYKDPERARP